MIFSRLLGRHLTGLAPALGAAGAVVQLGAIVGFAILAIERLLHGTGRIATWLHRRTRRDDGGASDADATSEVAALEIGAAAEPLAGVEAKNEAAVDRYVRRSAPVALPRRTFLEAAAATGA